MLKCKKFQKNGEEFGKRCKSRKKFWKILEILKNNNSNGVAKQEKWWKMVHKLINSK